MELTSRDIQMSKGYAILLMLMLHLFCLQGGAELGTHLIWVNSDTPVLYYLGWLCAICAPTYCICSGYAHYKQGGLNGLTLRKRLNRILKFMISFWCVCAFVAATGFLMGSEDIPGGLAEFIKNMFLVSWSYTGIWWFAFVYVVYVLLSKIMFKIVQKQNYIFVIGLLSAQFILVEGLEKILPMHLDSEILLWIWKRAYYLLGARLFCYIGGMYLAKYQCISRMNNYFDRLKKRNAIIGTALCAMCILLIKIDKGILLVPFSLVVFCGFNSLVLGKSISRVMLFLGKYSTYIWLLHPFIYSGKFEKITNLWLNLKYPFLLFVGLLACCIVVAVPIQALSGYIVKKTVCGQRNDSSVENRKFLR